MILTCVVKSKLFVVLGLLCSAFGVWAQSSAFTYQGQLSSNSVPVTGQFDLRFTLQDAATLGNPVGSPLTNAPTGVSNGLFVVILDFGAAAFDGGARWLEIGVRTNGSTNAYATLSPRQLITATPYAVRAANFSGPVPAANLTGTIPDTRLSPNVALLNTNVTFAGSVTATQFNGSGAGLTSLPAGSLTGTIPDARLSTNVAFLNTSNAVFKGAISATNFYGLGRGLTNVPGRIFEYVTTAANITATPNFGYLAVNNSSAVVVTLPPTANITNGETIRVTGAGTGGWIVAQNAGQVIQVANLTTTVGFAWRTNETSRVWDAVASSADGSKLVAVVNGGQIHTSVNYGTNWSPRDANRAWSSVASSADGTKLVACVNGGQIYTSTDSGASWSPRDAARAWSGVASSLDGVKLVAVVNGASGGIYTSENSGVNWTLRASLPNFTACAISGNGSNVVVTVQGGQIYTSVNGGFNYTPRESNRSWVCVASSGDGSRLVAGVNSGFLYVSPDFGASWIPISITANWAGLGCSADGSRMIAVANGGGVYVSTDTGINWQQRPNLPTGATIFTGATVSGDGSTMVAVANSNPIYISSQATTTVGTAGYLIGSRLSAVELQYVGNGVFIPISYLGNIRAQ
jgi:hypothetical protein